VMEPQIPSGQTGSPPLPRTTSGGSSKPMLLSASPAAARPRAHDIALFADTLGPGGRHFWETVAEISLFSAQATENTAFSPVLIELFACCTPRVTNVLKAFLLPMSARGSERLILHSPTPVIMEIVIGKNWMPQRRLSPSHP